MCKHQKVQEPNFLHVPITLREGNVLVKPTDLMLNELYCSSVICAHTSDALHMGAPALFWEYSGFPDFAQALISVLYGKLLCSF
jgi:hypothetical protein